MWNRSRGRLDIAGDPICRRRAEPRVWSRVPSTRFRGGKKLLQRFFLPLRVCFNGIYNKAFYRNLERNSPTLPPLSSLHAKRRGVGACPPLRVQRVEMSHLELLAGSVPAQPAGVPLWSRSDETSTIVSPASRERSSRQQLDNYLTTSRDTVTIVALDASNVRTRFLDTTCGASLPFRPGEYNPGVGYRRLGNTRSRADRLTRRSGSDRRHRNV